MNYSQHGEDGLIAGYFPKDYIGTAVEVGAGDGKHLSTTLSFEERGWRVLCIEPNPRFSDALIANRKLVECVACSDHDADDESFHLYDYPSAAHHGVVGVLEPLSERFMASFLPDARPTPTQVPVVTRTLTSLLMRNNFETVDFLSIDVDGIELAVLRGLDFDRFKPAVILVENPFELDELGSLLIGNNYYRDHARIGGFNDIYVREGL